MGNGSGHKNTSKSVFKSVWFWLVLVVLVVSGLSMAAGQSSDSTSESQTAAYQSEDEEDDYYDDDEDEVEADEYSSSYATSSSESDDIDDKIDRLVKSGKAFEAKDYIAGKIPAGEYAFVTDKYSSGKYYSEDDAAGEIIDNENFSSFGYVQVHSTGNLTTDGLLVNVDSLGELCVVGAKDLYEKLNHTSDYKGPGMYKVGSDLPAGHYVLKSTGKGYVAVLTGPVGNNDIEDNENFNGEYAVDVYDGQYLEVTRAMLNN